MRLLISAYFSVLVFVLFWFWFGLLVCRLIVLVFVAICNLDVVLRLALFIVLHVLGVAGDVVVCCVFFVFVFAEC